MVETIAALGVDPRLVLGPLAMMHADPTMRLGRHEAIRATYTPDGPGVTRLTWGQQSGEVTVDGAAWLLDQAPRLIGTHDDAGDFIPADPVVQRSRIGARRTRPQHHGATAPQCSLAQVTDAKWSLRMDPQRLLRNSGAACIVATVGTSPSVARPRSTSWARMRSASCATTG